MNGVDLSTLDAIGQAELVRAGELSATDLVAAAIERIEAVDPVINAVIYECFEQALVQAARPLSGPFAGVPLLLKGLGCPIEGHPDHRGSLALRQVDHRSTHECALAKRFADAGFVIVGRTNVPELGLVSDTRSSAYGATLNPWDLPRSPGGSSGGSAAAVAAGMAPVAHGADGGGSIRMPASHCGLVGLKPSRGRVSEAPDAGDPLFGHSASGVLTRTVRDTAAVLDVIAGVEPGDPTVAPVGAGSYLDAVGRPPRPLRIGFVTESPNPEYRTDDECRTAVETAARLLEEAGHAVEPTWPSALFDKWFWSKWFDALSPHVSLAVDGIRALVAPDSDVRFDAVTELWDRRGRQLSATELTSALLWLDDFRRRLALWWADGFDVLVTPVTIAPAPASGFFWSYEGGIEDSVHSLQFTPQFNTTGQPAISVPVHWTDAGLPVGVQLVGGYGQESLLLSLAAQIERLAPWADRYPAPAVAPTTRVRTGRT
jgi:amidase